MIIIRVLKNFLRLSFRCCSSVIRNKTQQSSIIHNNSHSNISLPCEEKTPIKLPFAAECLSPLSNIQNGKNNADNISQNSFGKFGVSEIKSTSNNKNFQKASKFVKNSKYVSCASQTFNSKNPAKNYQSQVLIKDQGYNRRLNRKKLCDNLTSASSIPRNLHKQDKLLKPKIFASECFNKNFSKLNSKTTIESKNTDASNKNTKMSVFKNNKENAIPAVSTGVSKACEEIEDRNDQDIMNLEQTFSSKMISEGGQLHQKNVANLTLEEYLLNYGRPYRNSLKGIESVTTWRVVNEEPSESYVSVDDEFLNETVDPLTVSIDHQRNVSCEAHKSQQASSCERKTANIKLLVLSAVKKTTGQSIRKQKSTSEVIDDFERKISSPLLQHAMSAFFNTSKIPPPTGPKSIRMSSNASVLFPIREEGGIGKMSINDDILDEVDSSPCSSLSSLNRMNGTEIKAVNMDSINQIDHAKERRGTNINLQFPIDNQIQVDTDSPKTKKNIDIKSKCLLHCD